MMAAPCAPWHCVRGPVRSGSRGRPFNLSVRHRKMAGGTIEVELTFLPTKDGGRTGPAKSGYRSQFYVDGGDWGAEHQYLGVAEVRPGETARAQIRFWAELPPRLSPGSAFLIREGDKIVAYGSVVSLSQTPGDA